MAGKDELGTAYLSIIPKVDGKNFSRALRTVEGSTGGSGTRAGNAFGGAMSVAVGNFAGNIATQAGSALVDGVRQVVQGAFDGFGTYEQMTGSMEAIFKDSSDVVVERSKEAFETAGLSANAYMETAARFSGAVLKSLGNDTAAAADMVDMAISDMADQVSVYGMEMSTVSETYTSLARGNYQMLDNLFGGMFAGTKAGLSEMLRTAEQYRAGLGETVSYSEDSYADIIQAIHDISEMQGVYGNQSREAAHTVQGSIAMTQAAWDNFLVSLGTGDPEMVSTNVGNLIASAQTALENAMPVLGNIVTSLASTIWDELYSNAPPEVQGIMDQLSSVVSDGMAVLSELWDTAWSSGFGEIVATVFEMIGDTVSTALAVIQGIIATVTALIHGDWDGFWEGILQTATSLLEGLASIVDLDLQEVVQFFANLPESIAGIFAGAGDWLLSAGRAIIDGLLSGLNAAWDGVCGFFGEITASIPQLKGPYDVDKRLLVENGSAIMQGLRVGLERGWGDVEGYLSSRTMEVGAICRVAVADGGTSGMGVGSLLMGELRAMRAAAGSVTNVYIDGARVNDGEAVNSAVGNFLFDLNRMAVI